MLAGAFLPLLFGFFFFSFPTSHTPPFHLLPPGFQFLPVSTSFSYFFCFCFFFPLWLHFHPLPTYFGE
ncbi:hypothetical protein DFJ73DRAFT_840345 [Zopfochytrium polystomum]|nr:hypothetical protein DFJ73DRAFT_840345 [Zopfochytrium polystomum]